MTGPHPSERLADVAPELERILTGGLEVPPLFGPSEIGRETIRMAMRDGICLATDLYLPPRVPAPAVAMRAPYGRARYADSFVAFAQRGYVVISQDCRGTGDSEPDTWDYCVYEREDSFDFVEWTVKQPWFGGFLAACGGSYVAETQWCMAFHPRMSTIAPEVGGLGVAVNTARLYMYLNTYARSVGKGSDKVPVAFRDLERHMLEETLAGGYFNEPLNQGFSEALLERYPQLRALSPSQGRRWLWTRYSALPPDQRAELIKLALGIDNVTITAIESLPSVFGQQIAHDAHLFPCAESSELCRSLHAPALIIAGWYDWGLNDALASWDLLKREAREGIRSRSRLLITPNAHNGPGYREGTEDHPELQRIYRTPNIVDLLLHWYAAIREGTTDSWPTVIYYLMGANEWRVANSWPPAEAKRADLYLGRNGTLTAQLPEGPSSPDRYTYDPVNPPPTVGGSIVSNVYRPGSVDVSEVQKRSDVLSYTTAPLEHDLDVVGPLRVILYASSSALDTDFSVRLSDVFSDGRAIQLQSGMLRARYRNFSGEPELLEPGRIYRLEIDLWATANRFKVGHCLRLDISSADFPRFDRNTNQGGKPGNPVPAQQTIYHDPEHPSHLIVSVLACQQTNE